MPAEASVDFMPEAFGPADLERSAAASFGGFGVLPGGVDADGARLGMRDIAEVIGEAGHGDGGPPQVPRLLLLPTTTVATALWFAEPYE